MPSQSPLSTGVAADSLEMYSNQVRLPCIIFIKKHYEHGGIDESGCGMLYRMAEMMSAVGWEVHVGLRSKIVGGGALVEMERCLGCLWEGCNAFNKNMTSAVTKAWEASNVLPELEGLRGDVLDTGLTTWRWRLRTLHTPTGNDRKLFKLLFEHYDSVAYQRLVHLNHRKAEYGLGTLVERATEVWHALRELCRLADEVDTVVLALREELQKALESLPEDVLTADQRSTVDVPQLSTPAPELLTAAVYKPPEMKLTNRTNPVFSKSLSAAEEEMIRRAHARAATPSEADYTTSISSANPAETRASHTSQSATVGSRRKGGQVPRIFTGSFSQLESDIRRLQLDKVKTPEEPTIAGTDNAVAVRDFAATPQGTAHTSPTSPTTPLQRREAFLSRETKIQDRVIKGEVITTRRPSTRGRSQPIHDETGGLEAWLKQDWLEQDSPSSRQPDMPGSAARHSHVRHRHNTR